jgi:hypothetical protein
MRTLFGPKLAPTSWVEALVPKAQLRRDRLPSNYAVTVISGRGLENPQVEVVSSELLKVQTPSGLSAENRETPLQRSSPPWSH